MVLIFKETVGLQSMASETFNSYFSNCNYNIASQWILAQLIFCKQ